MAMAANAYITDRNQSVARRTEELERKLKKIKLSKETSKKAKISFFREIKKLADIIAEKEMVQKQVDKYSKINMIALSAADYSKLNAKITKLERKISFLDVKESIILFKLAKPKKLANSFAENVKSNIDMFKIVKKWKNNEKQISENNKIVKETETIELPTSTQTNMAKDAESEIMLDIDTKKIEEKINDTFAIAENQNIDVVNSTEISEQINTDSIITNLLDSAVKNIEIDELDVKREKVPYANRQIKNFVDGTYAFEKENIIQDDLSTNGIFDAVKPLVSDSESIDRAPVISVVNMVRDGEKDSKLIEQKDIKFIEQKDEKLEDLSIEDLLSEIETARLSQEEVKKAAVAVREEMLSVAKELQNLESKEQSAQQELAKAEKDKVESEKALALAKEAQERTIAETKAALIAKRLVIKEERENYLKAQLEDAKALEEAKQIKTIKEQNIQNLSVEIPRVLNEAKGNADEAMKVKAKIEQIESMTLYNDLGSTNFKGTELPIVANTPALDNSDALYSIFTSDRGLSQNNDLGKGK